MKKNHFLRMRYCTGWLAGWLAVWLVGERKNRSDGQHGITAR